MRELIHIVEFHDITSDKVEFCGALADWFVQLASRHRNIDLPKRLTSLNFLTMTTFAKNVHDLLMTQMQSNQILRIFWSPKV